MAGQDTLAHTILPAKGESSHTHKCMLALFPGSPCFEVEGDLLVKALDCGSKRSRVPVPLAAEIYFSSGCTQPYPQKMCRRFTFVSFGGDIKPSVPRNPLILA